MSAKTARAFGSWTYGIGTQFVTAAGKYKSYADFVQAEDGTLFVTKVASEDGAKELFRCDSNSSEWQQVKTVGSVKNSVNEYGGAALFAKGRENFLYTSGPSIQWSRNGDERTFTHADCHFADLRVNGDFLYCVVENRQAKEYTQAIGRFRWGDEKQLDVLADEHDFYAAPRPSPDGCSLIYTAWKDGEMPWDKTSLGLIRFDEKGAKSGHEFLLKQFQQTEFNFQSVQWKNNEEFFFVSDLDGQWDVYEQKLSGGDPVRVASAAPHDIGDAQWTIGHDRFYAFNSNFVVYQDCRRLYAQRLHSEEKPIVLSNDDFTHFKHLHVDENNQVFCIAAGPVKGDTILRVKFGGDQNPKAIGTKVLDEIMNTDSIVHYGFHGGERFVTEVDGGDGKKLQVESFFFEPTNPRCCGPEGQLPPVIVLAHGGPTGQTYGVFDRKKLFYLSHGFAVCDVNYRGSTGYGREFRRALNGSWGEGDVTDTCDVAKELIRRKKVDPSAVFIMGGSSSGYGLLRALYKEPELFKAAICSYGFADLFALAAESHRFEKAYNYRLIADESDKRTWNERNMADKLNKIKTPVLLFHGTADTVVQWQQSQEIYDTLKKQGIRTDLKLFEGEGHGFRNASTIEEVLRESLKFMTAAIDVTPDLSEVVDLSAHL